MDLFSINFLPMKACLTLAIIVLFCSTSFGQKRVTIDDPEIQFSVVVPKKWKQFNDDYYYYLIIPSKSRNEYLTITYLETNDQSPDKNFDVAVNYFYPRNETGYKLLETGNDEVDGKPAKWGIFTSKYEGEEYKSILYMFIENNQIFKIRGITLSSNFEQYAETFVSTIKSIRSKKL